MAIMWPKKIPEWVKSDPRRGSEIKIFEKLEKELSEEWSIFYSRPWWGLNPKGGELDGEADFILANPNLGVLFIEVKGGGIAYTPENQRWVTKDREGITHNIKDPVSQAKICKHQFLLKLKKINDWPKGYVCMRHGVIFPDSLPPINNELFIGGYEKELFCFANRFEKDLLGWILERIKSTNLPMHENIEISPGVYGVKALYELIAKPVILRVPLLREVQGDIDSMENLLTGAQLALISIVESKRKIMVEGGAGTGKTILAIETAFREAQLGKEVLFICRSAPLAENIKKRMESYSSIFVSTFEDLKNQILSLEIQIHNLESIIIDEAQDFDWEWWDFIEEIIKKNQNIALRVFSDANQSVYRLRDDLQTRLSLESLQLNLNLRNTKEIAKITDKLYKGPFIIPIGPSGSMPQCSDCDLKDSIYRSTQLIKNLILNEQIDLKMIAILVPNANLREEAIIFLNKNNLPAADSMRSYGNMLVVETVARFKGLEASVVILISDRHLAKNQELSYVGVSRARSRLFVFGPIDNTLLGQSLNFC